MVEITERDRELTLSATSGEGLSTAVLDRIERAVARAREEGRQAGVKEALGEVPDNWPNSNEDIGSLLLAIREHISCLLEAQDD